MSDPHLVVRADGGPGIGTGHLARCLALVQAWTARGGTATLVSNGPPPDWAARYSAEGAAVVDPGRPPAGPVAWVVVDAYHLPAGERSEAARLGERVLCLDDHGEATGGSEPCATVILDQNLGASAAAYPGREPGRDLLLGPAYALLRREFRAWRGWKREVPDVAGSVLLVPGGAPDPAVADRLRSAAGAAGVPVRELSGAGASEVAEAMAACDLALAASGTVCWEICFMGLPAVVVPVAPNQQPIAAALGAAGAAVASGLDDPALGSRLAGLARDPGARAGLRDAGRGIVDGRGAERVVARLRSDLLALRPVGPDDARRLWEWANDPATRAAGFSPDPIPWEDHARWFAARLADRRGALFLATGPAGEAVGAVRFTDLGSGRVEVSLNVAPDRRGRGWGAPLILAGMRRFGRDHPGADVVVARIRPENTASRTAFGDAGFRFDGRDGQGAETWHFGRGRVGP